LKAAHTFSVLRLLPNNELDRGYIHQVIDHAETYVKGNVHTNGIENFWSLLKRGLKGTYVSVEPIPSVSLSG
jgi:hypothetical protein